MPVPATWVVPLLRRCEIRVEQLEDKFGSASPALVWVGKFGEKTV